MDIDNELKPILISTFIELNTVIYLLFISSIINNEITNIVHQTRLAVSLSLPHSVTSQVIKLFEGRIIIDYHDTIAPIKQ
jgi:hypothetical protein